MGVDEVPFTSTLRQRLDALAEEKSTLFHLTWGICQAIAKHERTHHSIVSQTVVNPLFHLISM